MDAGLPDAVWWPLGIEPGESLLGFAARTMEDNVLPHLAAILREAGQAHRNHTADVVRGDVTSEALAAVLGISVAQVERLRGGSDPEGCFRYMGIEMRPEDVCTSVRRFAPGGLAIKPIHRAAWTLRQLPICVESWQPLLYRCACKAVQDWTMVRDILLCQGCGEPLADVPVDSVPLQEQESLRVYAGLLSADSLIRDAALARLPTDLAAAGPGGAVDMVLGLAPVVDTSLHRSVRHPGTWRDRPLTFASAIARVMTGILKGPGALAETLIGCRPACAEPRTIQLGRLSSFLMGRGRTLLPTACVALLDEAAAGLVSPGPGDDLAIDFEEAEALLGRRRSTLRAARRAGTLRTAFYIRRGEILPALDRVEVERIAAAPGMGSNTFGRTLHLPAYAIEQMADTSVLGWIEHPFVLDTQGIRIRQGEGERLLKRLTECSVDLSVVETIGLSTLLRSIGGREKPYGHIFRMLIDGEVPFYLVSGSMLAARIRIRKEDAEEVRAEVLARPSYITFPAPRLFTQTDACDILNLHLRNRAAISTLRHESRNGGLLFETPVVLEAAERFVTAGELAALLGRNAMTVAGDLRQAGLHQASAFGWDRSIVFSQSSRVQTDRGSVTSQPDGLRSGCVYQ